MSRHRSSKAHSTVVVVWRSHPLFRYSYSLRQYPIQILYYILLKQKYQNQPLDLIAGDIYRLPCCSLVPNPGIMLWSSLHSTLRDAQTLITKKSWDFITNAFGHKAVILSLLHLCCRRTCTNKQTGFIIIFFGTEYRLTASHFRVVISS